jgi:restriction system protein
MVGFRLFGWLPVCEDVAARRDAEDLRSLSDGSTEHGMPVPTYNKFMEPIQRYLTAHPDGAAAREVHDAAATALGLSDADRAELLPSGVQLVFKNRAGWAHDRLKRAGLSSSRRRGYWQLTDAGTALVREQPTPIPETVLEAIATEHHDVRSRPATEPLEALPPSLQATIADRATVSPDDRLEQALSELREGVVAELWSCSQKSRRNTLRR